MGYYCEKCGLLHIETELCPYLLEQIRNDPSLLSQAATFTNVAAQYRLVTSQDFQMLTDTINKITGTNIRFEGTHQYIRDIQVFKRLNEEAFTRIGIFRSPSTAQNYLNNASPNQLKNLSGKLAGYGQEVDWLRKKQGQISSLLEKSDLLKNNAPGIDGVTIIRFSDNTISKTSVKAAQTIGGINTNVQSIVKSIKKGTFPPDGRIFGVKGIKNELMDKLTKEIKHAISIGDSGTVSKLTTAQQKIIVEEFNTPSKIFESVKRLQDKISNGQATIAITTEEVMKKIFQGSVIAAVVGLTVSAIKSYLRYRDGQLTREQAFTEVGEDTVKSMIMGAGMSGLTLFLPGGLLGVCGGRVIGIYIDTVLTNILDEVFGKGAYREILHASGFVLGTSIALAAAIKELELEHKMIKNIEKERQQIQKRIKHNQIEFDHLMDGIVE
jgi:hypothetical protein